MAVLSDPRPGLEYDADLFVDRVIGVHDGRNDLIDLPRGRMNRFRGNHQIPYGIRILCHNYPLLVTAAGNCQNISSIRPLTMRFASL